MLQKVVREWKFKRTTEPNAINEDSPPCTRTQHHLLASRSSR